jgi:hypothetical protein
MKHTPTVSLLLILAAAALAAGLASRPATAQPQTSRESAAKPAAPKRGEELRKFMRAKLDSSGKILEGLTTADFDKIAAGARELQRTTEAEQWQVSNDGMYRQHSNQFRRVAEQLEKRAMEKNLDGASLAWVECTLSCIECHKWVRAMIISNR